MAAWLSYRFGFSEASARERVEVAHALEQLPHIADTFASGLLCWDQLRWLVRFATTETDDELSRDAPGWHPSYLKTRALRAERISRDEVERTQRRRSLRTHWDQCERMLHLWARIPDADGELVLKTLERIRDQNSRPNPESGLYPPYDQSMADALVELCSVRTGADADPDRANIVCHVPAEALVKLSGNGVLESGVVVAPDTIRRLACDARLQILSVSKNGEPLGISRVSRTAPPWLTRELRRRDGGCRYPGCGRTRGLHAHHVHHWADGGPTNEDNLVLLCRFHHRLVHEGGYRLVVTPSRKLRVVRPDGRPLRSGPMPLRAPSTLTSTRPPARRDQPDAAPRTTSLRSARE